MAMSYGMGEDGSMGWFNTDTGQFTPDALPAAGVSPVSAGLGGMQQPQSLSPAVRDLLERGPFREVSPDGVNSNASYYGSFENWLANDPRAKAGIDWATQAAATGWTGPTDTGGGIGQMVLDLAKPLAPMALAAGGAGLLSGLGGTAAVGDIAATDIGVGTAGAGGAAEFGGGLAAPAAEVAGGSGLTVPAAATTTGGSAAGLGGSAGTGLGTGVGGGGLGAGLQAPVAMGGTATGLGLSSSSAGTGFGAGIAAESPALAAGLAPVAAGVTSSGVASGVGSAVGAPASAVAGTVPGSVGAGSSLLPLGASAATGLGQGTGAVPGAPGTPGGAPASTAPAAPGAPGTSPTGVPVPGSVPGGGTKVGGVDIGSLAPLLGAGGIAALAGSNSDKSDKYFKEISAIGQTQRDVATDLIRKAQAGEINPSDKMAIDQWKQKAIADAQQFYSKAGISDSTQLQGTLADINAKAASYTEQARQQLLQQGMNELNVTDQAQMEAIKAQIAMDQQAAKALTDFMTMLGTLGAKLPGLGGLGGGSTPGVSVPSGAGAPTTSGAGAGDTNTGGEVAAPEFIQPPAF